MKIHEIFKKYKRKNKKRICRGSAGKGGTTGGRGTKGQKARAGHNIPRGFEGGQTRLERRLPKIGGFRSHRKKNIIIKTSQINKNFKDGDIVSLKTLKQKNLIKKDLAIKILFDENIKNNIIIKDCKMSKKVAATFSITKLSSIKSKNNNIKK